MRRFVKHSARWPFVAWALLFAFSARAEVPNAISYQGILLDSTGQPLNVAANLHFRILRGGDDMTFPSAGSLVYHERATVQPVVGVFSHLIGSGAPAADCGGPCVLSSDTFAPGNVPTWIEVTVDPDGVAGDSDDDVLLPRTRVGTIAYAYRVASLDGAKGGNLSGTVVADTLVTRDDLRFEASGGSSTITWDPAAAQLELDRRARLEKGLTLAPYHSIAWGPLPDTVPPIHMRFNHWTLPTFDGNLDGIPDTKQTFSFCFNCQDGSSQREVPTDYSLHWLWDTNDSLAPGDRRITHRWNFISPGGSFQPFYFTLDTNLSNEYRAPTAKWMFRTSPTRTALMINQNGNLLVGSEAFLPAYPLDVVGSIHASDDLVLDKTQEVRFGTASALTTNATGSSLILGAGFSDLQLPTGVRFDQGLALGSPGLTLGDDAAVSWGPFANPVPGTYIRQVAIASAFADGNLDGVPDLDRSWGICYNCRRNSAVPDVAGEYQMIAQWEMTYAPAVGTRWIEHNWDFRDPAGNQFRPFGFMIDTDRAGAYANPRAGWTFSTSKNKVALQINSNGNVRIGADSPQPAYPLEVSGTVRADGDLRLSDAGALYLGSKKSLHTGPAGALVLGQDQDVVSVGSASFALSVCPAIIAASRIAVAECNVVQLGGTGSVQTIDTCDAGHAGRVLYVLCGGGLQLCDSCGTGNLRLSGNLDCTADDTLTLLCDGTVWKELDRSVN
jgi:hypothetical protein